MSLFNKEPKRNSDINSLNLNFRTKLKSLIHLMYKDGFDPIIFEAKRSQERQQYLYSIGRTIQKNRKPVTWTLKSKHFTGNAADIISKSYGWDWPTFFAALKLHAKEVGLQTLVQEGCHVQMPF